LCAAAERLGADRNNSEEVFGRSGDKRNEYSRVPLCERASGINRAA